MQQKLVQNFFTSRRWSFWIQNRKGTVKAPLKIKNDKGPMYIFTENICSASNPMQAVVFCKHALILNNNNLHFLILKVA